MSVVRKHLPHATVLCIAHRLSHALSADKVLVLQDGKVVEEGHPSALLANAQGHFSALIAASHEGSSAP
jgi:ABC-type multidrug transport system fused ATPase/permease subunit